MMTRRARGGDYSINHRIFLGQSAPAGPKESRLYFFQVVSYNRLFDWKLHRGHQARLVVAVPGLIVHFHSNIFTSILSPLQSK